VKICIIPIPLRVHPWSNHVANHNPNRNNPPFTYRKIAPVLYSKSFALAVLVIMMSVYNYLIRSQRNSIQIPSAICFPIASSYADDFVHIDIAFIRSHIGFAAFGSDLLVKIPTKAKSSGTKPYTKRYRITYEMDLAR